MEEPQSTPDAPAFSFKRRNVKTKTNLRKKEATPPPASDSDSGFASSDEEGRQIKRRRKNIGVIAVSTSIKPSLPQDIPTTSSTPVPITTTKDDATRTSNWFDEAPTQTTQPTSTTSATDTPGVYRGASSYQSFLPRNPNSQAPTTKVGPVKSSSNVRTITTTDFAPDVCKDYKQVGFCGFGDSCKFLHAREDYKQGWQLDREWEIGTKGKQQAGKTFASAGSKRNTTGFTGTAGTEEEDDEDKLLESIPFACIICKGDYKSPIVTKCNHYFCEACALKRYRKDPSCAACGAGTGGVFNVAKKLNKLLERKRERELERTEKEKEKETTSG